MNSAVVYSCTENDKFGASLSFTFFGAFVTLQIRMLEYSESKVQVLLRALSLRLTLSVCAWFRGALDVESTYILSPVFRQLGDS